MSIREFLSRDASIRLSEMKNVTIIVTRRNNKKKSKKFCQYSGKHTFLSTNTLKAQALCTSDLFSFFI